MRRNDDYETADRQMPIVLPNKGKRASTEFSHCDNKLDEMELSNTQRGSIGLNRLIVNSPKLVISFPQHLFPH